MTKKLLITIVLCLLFCGPGLAQSNASMRLQTLVPELRLRTSFADDYGETLEEVVYDGVSYRPHEATKKVLPQLKWQQRDDRLELSEAWVRTMALHGCEVLEKGHRRLPEGATGPKVEFLEDGTFQFTGWVMILTGRHPGGVAWRKVTITPEADMKVESQGPEPGLY